MGIALVLSHGKTAATRSKVKDWIYQMRCIRLVYPVRNPKLSLASTRHFLRTCKVLSGVIRAKTANHQEELVGPGQS